MTKDAGDDGVHPIQKHSGEPCPQRYIRRVENREKVSGFTIAIHCGTTLSELAESIPCLYLITLPILSRTNHLLLGHLVSVMIDLLRKRT